MCRSEGLASRLNMCNACSPGAPSKVQTGNDSRGWAAAWLMRESKDEKNDSTLLEGTVLSTHWNSEVHDKKKPKGTERNSDLDEIKQEVDSGELKDHEDFRAVREFAS